MTQKTHIIKFRVTADQKKQIFRQMEQQGEVKLSNYVRKILLNSCLVSTISENNKLIKMLQEDFSWMKQNLNG